MMTAPAEALKTPEYSGISASTLDFLAVFLETLIREQSVGERAQLLLFRIAAPVCVLADGDPEFFLNRNHPARQIFESIAAIASLSGEQFAPGDTLYKTTVESIQTLQAKRVSGYETLQRVHADLVHVHKLARMRAPITINRERVSHNDFADAKTIAALHIVQHCHRFHASEALLYFVLTDWLSLMVVTILQKGRESDATKEFDRLTFMLLYLATKKHGEKRDTFFAYFPRKLKQHILSLEKDCHGHKVDFKGMLAQADKLLAAQTAR